MSDTWSDPTRSGPPLGIAAGETLSLSHNEIQSLCFKAARGAGRPWGIAEEAGFAAAWLASHHIDGLSVLAEQLGNTDGLTSQSLQPCVRPGRWQPVCPGQSLCPIAVGVTLIDFVQVNPAIFRGDGLVIDTMSYPLLVLPFIALSATDLDTTLEIRLNARDGQEEAGVRISSSGLLHGGVSAFLALESGTLRIAVEQGGSVSASERDADSVDAGGQRGVSVMASNEAGITFNSSVLGLLDSLSMRTTVPASSRSRADAGAGDKDSD